MALDPSIILSAQSPDIIGNFSRGIQTGQQMRQAQTQNRLTDLYQAQGAQIAAGDQNALNALASISPDMALNVQNTRLGMDQTRQSMQIQAEQAKRAAAEYAKGLSAEQRAAEAARLERGLKGAEFFYQKGDKQGYMQFLQQQGIDSAQFPFEQFPAAAASAGVFLEALKAPAAPEYKTVGNQLYQITGTASGKPEPVGSGAGQGMVFRQTMPDGSIVEFGESGLPGQGAGAGQDPQQTATPRDPAQMSKKLADSDVAEITRQREIASAAGDLESIAGQMEVLAPEIGYTGFGGEVYGKVDDLFGVLPGDSGARGAFRSLSTDAQLTFTAKTKGAITEREMALFASAVPSLGQTKEGNAAISQVLRAGAKRTQDKLAFLEEYAARYGSLQGSQAAWQRFMNDNPIIVRGQSGGVVVRPDGDWRSYLDQGIYSGESRDGDGAPLGGISPQAIEMLKQNPTPEYRKFFDDVFGNGQAAKVLGGN